MTSDVLIYLGLGVAVAAGAFLVARRKHLGVIERITRFVLPAVGLVLAGTLVTEFCESFFRIFTDARLAPAASLLCGYKLYYPLEHGPILGMMYTPLAALMYIPAVLAPTPEAAVSIAEILTMVYYFAPAAAVLIGESRRAQVSWGLTALVIASFGLMTELINALVGPAFWIHADAPAIGFAAGACAWLHIRRPDSRFVSFLGPAALATAAVLSKQVAVPMLAAIPLCALILDGRKACSRAATAVAATTLVAGGVILCTGDVDTLVLNAVLQPLRQPWYWSPLEAMWQAGSELVQSVAWPMGIIAATAFFTRWPDHRALKTRDRALKLEGASFAHCDATSTAPPSSLGGENVRCDGPPRMELRWRIWVIVALLMIPSSLLGRVKRGGDEHAFGYTVYFLAVAAHLRLVHICSGNDGFRPRIPDEARIVPLQLAVSIAAWLAPGIAARLPRAIARFPENPERVGFEYAKRHPGEVYFPFHPLISIMSEGRAYHFSDGVTSRELANMHASERHLRAFVPDRLEIVAFIEPTDDSRKYLPEYWRHITVHGLKGWNVFGKWKSGDELD
jgi:hypothetical protein